MAELHAGAPSTVEMLERYERSLRAELLIPGGGDDETLDRWLMVVHARAMIDVALVIRDAAAPPVPGPGPAQPVPRD